MRRVIDVNVRVADDYERPLTTYKIFIQIADDLWQVLDLTVLDRCQADAVKQATRLLALDDEWGSAVQDGIGIAVVADGHFNPRVVQVEPQPPKLVVR